MHYVHNMCQFAQEYYAEIPQNTLRAMSYSFGAVFIIRSIVRNDPKAGLVAGLISATAAAIHGLVTPLFKLICAHNPLNWNEEMCRTFTAIIGAGCIAGAFGEWSIIQNLLPFSVIYGILTYFSPNRRDLNSANYIPLFPDYFNAADVIPKSVPVPAPAT